MVDVSKDDIVLIVKEAAQAVGQQTASQLAQQVAEQVGQAVSQAISKTLQSFTQTTGGQELTGKTIGREEMGDIGGTESIESDLITHGRILNANVKRTYDEYQHESLESIKRNRSYVDKILADAASHDNRTRIIAEQALQNAVESANMISKQAVAHRDIAIDHEWNIDEQGYTSASVLDAMNAPAVKQAMSATIADIITAMAEKKA